MVHEIDEVQRFFNTFERSAIGIAVTVPSGRFALANQTYCHITGYEQQELRLKDDQSITHPDDLANSQGLAKRLFAGEISSSVCEKRYVRKDCDIVWVRNSVSVLRDGAGVPTHAVTLTEDITARKHAEESMHAANRRLRQLSWDLLRSEDNERRRIARELHDSTLQLLSGVFMNLEALRGWDLDPIRRPELLSETIDLAGQCIREIRTLSWLLHPLLLEELGLAAALQDYADGFRLRSGIEIETRIPPDLGRLNRDMEMTIFRIIQEGLANIHRHSESTVATITLERDAREIRLELADRGRGLPTALTGEKGMPRLGVGIQSMRERAELLGGSLQISFTESGTRLTLVLPLLQP